MPGMMTIYQRNTKGKLLLGGQFFIKTDCLSREQGIDCLVGELNSKLQEYKMKLRYGFNASYIYTDCRISIRKFRAEDTDGKLYWVLVNTVSDKVAQQATSLKDWQG